MQDWTIDRILESFILDENFIFLDVGTNRGEEAEVLLPLGVVVHSFEPHPKIAKYIKEKFMEYENHIFNEAAAWIANENKCFYYKKDPEFEQNWMTDGGSTLIPEKTNITGNYSDNVRCIDLSEYILNLDNRINVLKIDVEGSEYHIIRHLIETGSINMVDNIFFEDHSRKIISTFSEFYENKKFVLDKINSLNTNFGYW